MTTYDFAVIGSGIAGVSIAARLSSNARVLIIEREHAPCFHATGRSAALYSALYGNDMVRAFTRASRAFFTSPPPGFSEHPLVTPRGTLYVGRDEDAGAIDLIAQSPLARAVSSVEAAALVPVLRPATARFCAYEQDAFDIDVHALHSGFLRMALGRHATLACHADVRALRRSAGRWEIVTDAGTFWSRVVVNAAGAWADAIAQLAGARPLGLQPYRRTAMLVDGPDALSCRQWPAVIAADESFYFKPDAGGLLLSPADETPSAPCDAQADELDIAICVDRIEARTSLRVRRVRRAWAGLRTFAPDRRPVVGYDARVGNFFWLAGQGGAGLQTAPALSELAAALAVGAGLPEGTREEGVDIEHLSPGRFDEASPSVGAH